MLYQQNILALALSLPPQRVAAELDRPASIKETAMIATTIAAIGRNQVTSTRACCGSASARMTYRIFRTIG